MKIRIKVTYLWAGELRKKAAAHRDEAETLMNKKMADHHDWHHSKRAVINAQICHFQEDAIGYEQGAAKVMARLLIAHEHTDCVFAKIDLKLSEVPLPPVL